MFSRENFEVIFNLARRAVAEESPCISAESFIRGSNRQSIVSTLYSVQVTEGLDSNLQKIRLSNANYTLSEVREKVARTASEVLCGLNI